MIRVTSNLDYETAEMYNLTVKVVDLKGLYAISYLILNIVDVNETPVIVSNTTVVEINEDVWSGYVIVNNLVVDPENDPLQYNITKMWPEAGPFDIQKNGMWTR